jgi:hypothetical protein
MGRNRRANGVKQWGKTGRNEPCPCGSGVKYKKCHQDRDQAKQVPYHESAKKLLHFRKGERVCLYPSTGGPCSGQVIRAHSISESAALARIARVGKVYQLNTNPFAIQKSQGEPQLKLENIAAATTFTGFCSSHDHQLFKPIDQGSLSPTREQAFLLHYRALCRELYVKRPNLDTNELLRDADRGRPVSIQAMVQGYVAARRVAIVESIKQMESDKQICDQAILVSDYGFLRAGYIRFCKTPTLACSGYTQPSFDFSGAEVQDLADMSKPCLNLSFTLLPNDHGGIAVFAWLDSADSICRTFVQSFMSTTNDRKSDALVQYTFDSFENFAVQPDWWENLPSDAQADSKMKMLNWTDLTVGIDPGTLIPGLIRFTDWEVEATGWL